MSSQSSASLYILLLRQPTKGPHPTAAQMRQIMERFGVWMEDIRTQGLLVSSHGLKNKGKVLRGPRGATISDGPYAETKEIVGGYILIKAGSMARALRVARGCPGLDYRLAVEVRPVKH
ncbi:MAG: hypothetical protein HYV95_01745 [Opitutae bacterium]|nr:hypothetical protein [Opitutae bacterium]